MSFVHPLLLGGLALVAVPVILHLIMRQQPQRLIFPAFRFLRQKLRSNRRRLRLRHWLLLALRMALIALMCLALARPKLFSDRLAGLGQEQVADIILILDTSPSMEYVVTGVSRLDDARERAIELLGSLGDASRIAVLDSGDPRAEWQPSRAAAREALASLTIRPANRPVTDALDAGLRLFSGPEADTAAEEARPRFIFVFSDRTPASWDSPRVADLQARLAAIADPKPRLLYVDVGVEKPVDLAIADLDVKPQAVPANRPVVFQVTLQATGQDADTEVLCRFNGEASAERKPVKLKNGERQVITFERRGLPPGVHQAEVAIVTNDSLPYENTRFATVQVREPRQVLVLCDDPADARLWKSAIEAAGMYQCDVKVVSERETQRLAPGDLARYQAICLVQVARPGPALWEKLEAYVAQGGGLAVVPGGKEVDREDYSRPESSAQRLLPGALVKLDSNRDGLGFTEFQFAHRALARFRDWMALPDTDFVLVPPRTFTFWEVKAQPGALVLLRYAEADKRPALLERTSDNGRGRAILFTSPLDGRRDAAGNPANDYLKSSFFFVLVNEVVRYLAGEAQDASLNHLLGPPVLVELPLTPRFPTYTLQGPGISGTDSTVPRAEKAGELRLAQPRLPGNYQLSGGGRQWITGFTLNVAPEECLLLPRLAAEAIEALFGPDAIVTPGPNRKLSEALEGQIRQPIELFPWLMLLLLFALVIENFLANRFYRADPTQAAA